MNLIVVALFGDWAHFGIPSIWQSGLAAPMLPFPGTASAQAHASVFPNLFNGLQIGGAYGWLRPHAHDHGIHSHHGNPHHGKKPCDSQKPNKGNIFSLTFPLTLNPFLPSLRPVPANPTIPFPVLPPSSPPVPFPALPPTPFPSLPPVPLPSPPPVPYPSPPPVLPPSPPPVPPPSPPPAPYPSPPLPVDGPAEAPHGHLHIQPPGLPEATGCVTSCPKNYAPICAGPVNSANPVDFQTYTNRCEFESYKCSVGDLDWEFKEDGECKKATKLPEAPVTEPPIEAPQPAPVPCPTRPVYSD